MGDILDEAGGPLLDEAGNPLLSESGGGGNPLMETLIDDFSVDDLAVLWDNSYGSPSVSGGQCVLPCITAYTALQSTYVYDLTSSYAYCKMTPDQGGSGYQTDLFISTDLYDNGYQIGYESGNLVGSTFVSAVQSVIGSTTYDPVAHAWVRIRESAGTIYYETAPDGLTWTTQWTSSEPVAITAMYAAAYTGHGSGADGTSYISNFNVAPVTTIAYIVQQVTGGVTGSYGIGTTLISSSAGNGLVAFIGWNCVTSGTYVGVPSACVSDSTGNLWKQIGISRGGPGISSTTRCAIWATVGAAPVDWVSIGIAGYSASAAWTIAEIAGLAQAIDLDYSVSVNSGSTSPTLTGVASEPDIGFTLFASGNGSQTLASVSAGAGSALTTSVSSTGSAPTGMSVYPYWDSSVPAGTVITSGTFGTASSYSVVQCGLFISASPPAQASVDWPVITMEAAFGATPGNISSSLDYTFSSEYVPWTDISNRVIGDAVTGRVTATRGREYELQQEEAGSMTAYLSNYDGAFTPTNPGSPYYSNALNGNMSFQAGVAGWVGRNGASLSSSTAHAYATGLNAASYASMLITPDGSSTEPTALSSAPTAVNQNYPYTFSCWMMCPAGWSAGALMEVSWFGSGGVIGFTYGSVTALPAGVWTQVTCLAATPPSGSETVYFGPQVQGTPSGSTLFYVAEAAAVAGSSVVSTGLVALEAPVRLSCWWEGRQYPLWTGYVERWPQGWPDMPQWGFSQITATDALAVAASNSMQSALIGEVLIDNPYAYLPCNEQYTTQVVGATPTNLFFYSGSPQLVPVDANGQTALNKANGNQVSGVYFDGQNQQVSTGLSINFLGDDGTAMGAAGYSGNAVGQGGPSMQYNDPGLAGIAAASTGFTIEFWFVLDSASDNVTLFTTYGAPSAFAADISAIYSNGLSIIVDYGTSLLNLAVNGFALGSSLTPLSINTPHHLALVFTGATGTQTVLGYIDGVLVPTMGGSITQPYAAMNAVILGSGRYAYDCSTSNINDYGVNNYVAGHLAIYNYQLPAGRVLAHYEAGAAGWSGVSAAQRFAQVLDWAQLGLKRGGYLQSSATGVPEITQIGPAYQLNGSTASDAVNAIAQSEGGQYYVRADGTIIYLERPRAYNLATQATLGDNATSATNFLNYNPEFSRGVTGWSATDGAVAYSSAQTYGGSGSALLTASGSGNSTLYGSSITVTPGVSYTVGVWVWSPDGCAYAFTGFAFYLNGSYVSYSTSYFSAAGGSWTYGSATVECPASGVNQFRIITGDGTGPPSGSQIYFAYAAMWEASPEVPYERETEFDYDNSYLYNEVTATLESGPNDLTVYDDRNLPSEQSYFRRSALSITSNVVSPYDVSDVTTWSIASFSQPTLHVASVKIDVAANPLVAFPVVLNVDIGDIVQVNRRPIGGAVISELGIVEKISYEVGPRYFYVTYQLSPYAPSNQVLCADTTGYDDPGSNNSLILGW